MCKLTAKLICSDDAIKDFGKYLAKTENIEGKLLRVNALLAMSGMVMGVMVGIGAYGQRYRYHPFTRYLFLGANTLFLPIISYVVSTIKTQDDISFLSGDKIISACCDPDEHITHVLLWASLVLIAGVNTSAIVAGDDRKGRAIAPPTMVLLVQAIWTSYLTVNFLGQPAWYTPEKRYWSLDNLGTPYTLILLPPFILIMAKLLLKYYASYIARGSLAFGRNPHLIVGYMEQLKYGSQHAELASEHSLPPLLVTGEDRALVDKQPRGYGLKRMSNQADRKRINNNGLVTIDKVWQLEDDIFPRSSTKQLKDVCLSFALFKLLRCRFARQAIIAETGFLKAYNFLPHVLLQDSDDERAFRVIAHELSFLQDYYYFPLPITYSKSWLPILSVFISLATICWGLLVTFGFLIVSFFTGGSHHGQIICHMDCSFGNRIDYGCIYHDILPLCLLAALVVLAEVRDIASYICSNWTKVALICNYVRHAASWQQSPLKKKLLGRLLRCRWKLLKQWDDRMNQCSLLFLCPSRTPGALLRRLIPLLDKKKVPTAVKAAVRKSLRTHVGIRSNGVESLCRRLDLQTGNNPLSEANGVKGTADAMLVCHIATSILEVRWEPGHADSAHKIAATHLSRYCAYLVAYAPELLPDDDEWCKSLYKAVQKEAKGALAGGVGAASTPEAEYRRVVQALMSAGSDQHHVLKNGAELGKKLVELAAAGGEDAEAEGEDVAAGGEEAAWEILADFWSEMILYSAPSDNVDAHAEAVARGGELITLLWALLTHIGVISRLDSAGSAGADGAV